MTLRSEHFRTCLNTDLIPTESTHRCTSRCHDSAIGERVEHHPLVSKVTEASDKEGGGGVTIIHMVPIS